MEKNIGAMTQEEFEGMFLTAMRASLPLLIKAIDHKQEDWITVSEGMEILKVKRTAFYDRVNAGKIAIYKDPDGNRTWVNRQELYDYMKSCKVTPKKRTL